MEIRLQPERLEALQAAATAEGKTPEQVAQAIVDAACDQFIYKFTIVPTREEAITLRIENASLRAQLEARSIPVG